MTDYYLGEILGGILYFAALSLAFTLGVVYFNSLYRAIRSLFLPTKERSAYPIVSTASWWGLSISVFMLPPLLILWMLISWFNSLTSTIPAS